MTLLRLLSGRLGSSPRVRGKPMLVSANDDSARLIPARAGKTHRHS